MGATFQNQEDFQFFLFPTADCRLPTADYFAVVAAIAAM